MFKYLVATLAAASSVNAHVSNGVSVIIDRVGYGKKNTELDTTKSCSTYTDCFQCTLSSCNWDITK